jgi:hypothetical protein
MGRWPLVVFVAVLAVAALVALRFLTEPREAISSTPSAYTGLQRPLTLPANGVVCADEVVYDTNSGIVRFGATAAAGTRAPALQVVAQGYTDGDYRSGYRSAVRVPGGWTGTRELDVPLRPPHTPVFGTLCVHNLEARAIDLVGSEDGRAYSRPSVTVNGQPTALELEFRLLEPGRHSMLSRVGRITTQAATLKPFGAWWWWVLSLALLVLAPVGVGLTIRSAFAADGARFAADRLPAGSWPDMTRVRARLAALPGWALVGAAVVLAVAWFCYWGFNTHVFQNDEDQYVYLSRWLQLDFPRSLFEFTAYGRGLQRLEVWLLAIPSALFDSPWSLQGGRLLNSIAFASTAIPVYKIARRLAVRPAWAALAAALSIATPWVVVTTGFLTENVAYPAFAWAVWAIFRTASAPRWWRDVLALVLLVVAGAARSGLLILVPVLPLVVAATGLRCGPRPVGRRVLALLRDHLVLWAAVAAGVAVVIAGALGVEPATGLVRRLAGGYDTTTGFEVGRMLAKIGGYLSKVVVGTGFFSAAVGLPWLAVQLVRSRDPARFAFAALVLVGSLAMFYSLNTAGPDERYVLYLAPFTLVPAAAALSHREVSPGGLALASALLALLLLRVPWTATGIGFVHFVSPVETIYTHAALKLTGYLPGDWLDMTRLIALAFGAAGVACAAVMRWRPARLTGATGAVLVAAVALSVPAQAQYTLSKFVNGVGAKAGPSVRERAFADTLVPDGATVGVFEEGVGQEPSFFGNWQEVQFYNQRLDTVYTLGPNVNVWPPGDMLVENVGYDERTGRVTSPLPLPDYFVMPTQVGKVRIRGEVISAPSYIPVQLVRLDRPVTLAWSASGFGPTGELTEPDGGRVRFYGTGLPAGDYCASYVLIAPPEKPAGYRFTRDRDRIAAGQVAAAQAQTVQVPLSGLAERDNLDVRVSGAGLRVAGITVDRC